MKKVIIVGASTGIGSELAKKFAQEGWQIGITARRENLLQALAAEFPSVKWHIKAMDTSNHDAARNILQHLITEMNGVDIFIYNAGIGESSSKWEKENNMHQVNAIGFAALANFMFKYFKEGKLTGQIVGISSVASQRGTKTSIGYAATKAFMSTYMQGQRQAAGSKKLPITITDIRPGYIETPMTEGQKGMFWVAKSNHAATLIYKAIISKKNVAYIPGKWRFAAWVVRNIPEFIWNRM
ncbi:MAG: SDR family NAD(P)-dependent oxidoreductase [Chitinophagales bacterium]|nr:SDR family NAD(P)-dependent oxidoreductase [Chitinophagales bacterium]